MDRIGIYKNEGRVRAVKNYPEHFTQGWYDNRYEEEMDRRWRDGRLEGKRVIE